MPTDDADLVAAIDRATGGTVHRLTADGPACAAPADGWLALDVDPARITCPTCREV